MWKLVHVNLILWGLDRFSQIGIIYHHLDRFFNLGVVPRYEPVGTLKAGSTIKQIESIIFPKGGVGIKLIDPIIFLEVSWSIHLNGQIWLLETFSSYGSAIKLDRPIIFLEGSSTIELIYTNIYIEEVITGNHNVPIGLIEGLDWALYLSSTLDSLNSMMSMTCPWVTNNLVVIQPDKKIHTPREAKLSEGLFRLITFIGWSNWV